MADIVFILGAGASVDAGAPVMANFIEKARYFYDQNKSGKLIPAMDQTTVDSFKTAFDAIGNLQMVNSKSQFDVFNIDDPAKSIISRK